MRPDVIVAGAGPAGSLTALMLARAGLRVQVVDRAEFPRAKLCGDSINPGAMRVLRRIGVADAVERAGIPVRGMIVSGPGGVQVRGEYPAPARGVSIARADLDWILLRCALEAGASFEPRVRVSGPVVNRRGRVIGIAVGGRHGSPREITAPLTIAADGRRSVLATALGLVRQPRTPRRWAIGAYFDSGASDAAFGEMHVRRGMYFGVAPLPDGRTNACLVLPRPARGALADPAALLVGALRVDPLVGRRFARARLVSRPTVLGPLAVDGRRAGVEGLLLAGDAAGFIDPMTGDGLRFAFRGAELAAGVALEALGGRVSDPAAELQRRRRRAFGRKWALNRGLRRLVGSRSAIAAATFAARVYPSAIRRVITAAADITAE
ncbi:MAG TPA: NAD(P)/FAD-dependent oxidoreductase [Vicinamibacterales bacterium]|nr:NAD(P)/FAD-dependent oxidoreductase [Vicinamibacterales bacterium]